MAVWTATPSMVRNWPESAVSSIPQIWQLSGAKLPLRAYGQGQVHSAAIKGRPSGRPACFSDKPLAAPPLRLASQHGGRGVAGCA
jgi:hypothetical protein